MLNSDLSPEDPQGGREPPTDITRVVSTRRRVPANWFPGRILRPSIESVITNSFVPSDFLVEGQVSGLGAVHPLLTLNFFSTWILPLHVVLKRKSLSSVMDGLQRRGREEISNSFASLNCFILLTCGMNILGVIVAFGSGYVVLMFSGPPPPLRSLEQFLL